MPSIRRIPEDKRRSRTGCLPCRKRRRKCDEKKPQCANCQARNVPCAYKDWTFVPEATPARGGGTGARRVAAADDGDHDDGGGAVVTGTPGSSAGTHHGGSQRLTPRSADLSAVAFAYHAGSDAAATPAPSTVFRTNTAVPAHTPAGEAFGAGGEQGDARQLAVILSHFRYQLAPWMDSVAPRSTFATDLLALAHDGRPQLLDAAAELVARHDSGLAEHVSSWRRHRRPPPPQHHGSDDAGAGPVEAITDALVALQAFFGAPVAAWGTVASSFAVPEHQRDDRGLQYMAQPLQTLVRLHCKIDLGSALLGQTAPRLGLPISTAPVTAPDGSALAPLAFYDACLAQLADCLALCARDAPTAPQPLPHQAWLLLWTRCLRWYETRPPAMAPIATSGRLGAHHAAAAAAAAAVSGPSPGAAASPTPTPTSTVVEALEAPFPTEVYTSVLAVQASIATHLALALLLAHKPRLLQVQLQAQRLRLRLPARLASRRWHAQTIAAIAASNHFAEQSDPVVVAALLWVARDMTHPLQQQALVDGLAAGGRAAGIDLRDELAQLHAHWQAFFRQPLPGRLGSREGEGGEWMS